MSGWVYGSASNDGNDLRAEMKQAAPPRRGRAPEPAHCRRAMLYASRPAEAPPGPAGPTSAKLPRESLPISRCSISIRCPLRADWKIRSASPFSARLAPTP